MVFPVPTSNVSQWAWMNYNLAGMSSTFSSPLSLSTNTVTCSTCVVASSPGVGLAHFAGSTQAVTSSAVSLTADVSGILPAANGGSGVANTATHTLGSSNQNWATLGTGIVKNTTTTGALSNAAAADVYGLWSGPCSSSTFLRGDGSCQTPSGSGITTVGAGYVRPFGWCDYCLAVAGPINSSPSVYQFVPSVGISVSTVQLELGTTGSAFGTVGFYSDSSGSCNALIAQATPVNLVAGTGTLAVFSFGSPVALSTGSVYWLMLSSDSGSVALGYYGSGQPALTTVLNQTSHARVGNAANAATGTGAGLTLPSTCGTVTAGNLGIPGSVVLLP